MLKNKKARCFQIDVLRGIAMILVVCAHMDWFVMKRFPTFDEVLMDNDMPVFFLISGFFSFSLSLNKEKFGDKIFNGLACVLYPSILFFFLYVAATGLSVSASIADPMKQGYWFTFVLFEVTIIYTCLLYAAIHIRVLNRNLSLFHISLLFASFVMMKLIAGNPMSGSWFDVLSIGLLLRYMPFFILGALCRIHFDKFKGLLNHPVYLVALGLLWIAGMSMRFIGGGEIPFSMAIYRFSPLAGVIVIFFLCVNYIPDNWEDSGVCRILCGIGTNTLQIYLLHYFFIAAIVGLSDGVLSALPIMVESLVYMVGISVLLIGPLGILRLLRYTRLESFIFPRRGLFTTISRWQTGQA